MSIRIVPESERTGGVEHIAALQLPPAALPYSQRAARLRQLAQGHTMADYLEWAAELSDAQQATALALPLPDADRAAMQQLAEQGLQHTPTPLHSAYFKRSVHWLELLDTMLAQLQQRPSMQSAELQAAIGSLQAASTAQREQWADALLAALRSDLLHDEAQDQDGGSQPNNAALPEAGVAQLLWSALSIYWRQLASALPVTGVAEGHERHACPVCNHAPAGSLILGGNQAGVRYVQCSLCESQWHVVRVRCTQCDSGGQLEYWCLDNEKAAVKAETCGDCGSYLKAFYQQTEHTIDVVADDLATLALDAEMDAKGIARSGVNPLMLPGLVDEA